jgi:hypothetical protein
VGNTVMTCDSDCFPCEIMVKSKSKVAATSNHILLEHINWLASPHASLSAITISCLAINNSSYYMNLK